MDKEKIARINELAKKKKETGLTDEEHEERQRLHREYIEEFRAGFKAQLDSTVIVRPDGTREKLRPKKPADTEKS